MAKSRAGRINNTILLVLVCAGSAILGLALRDSRLAVAKTARLGAQASDEKVVLRYAADNEPVEFSDFRVDRVNIRPGLKFSAQAIAERRRKPGKDWLENLNFKIRNVSDKRIVFILLALHFPDATVNGARMLYHLEIGVDPAASAETQKLKQESAQHLALDPGDAFTFVLSARELQKIKDFLALQNFQIADLNQVAIVLGPVVFDDRMKWDNRHFYKPNPRAPGGYERIDQIKQ